MRPTDMHKISRRGTHTNGPKGWHDVPNVTGDYDMDATILHRNNKNMPLRLNLYVIKTSGYNGEGYGEKAVGESPPSKRNNYEPRTGYEGYEGYHGDD